MKADHTSPSIRVSTNAPVEVLVRRGAMRTLRWAACRLHAAKERGDKVAMAAARTSTADARGGLNLAHGVDLEDIDSLGYNTNRDAYERSRESWQRVHLDDPSSEWVITHAHIARADWLARRPEWDDDWGIPTITDRSET